MNENAQPTNDLAAAQAVIENEKRMRTDHCQQVINAALQADRCTLVIGMFITATGNMPQVQIVAQ